MAKKFVPGVAILSIPEARDIVLIMTRLSTADDRAALSSALTARGIYPLLSSVQPGGRSRLVIGYDQGVRASDAIALLKQIIGEAGLRATMVTSED